MGSDDHKLRNNAIATWQGNENSTRSEGNHPGGLPLSPGTRIRYNNLPHYVNIELLFFSLFPRIEEEGWDKYIIPSKTEPEKYKVSRTFSFIKSRMYSTRSKKVYILSAVLKLNESLSKYTLSIHTGDS